ncbi:MAG: Peptidoglycan-N-acetylmuramic acid deacetylase PdaC [Desulfovibrio sp.]
MCYTFAMPSREKLFPTIKALLRACCCATLATAFAFSPCSVEAATAARPKQPAQARQAGQAKRVDSYTITQRGDGYRINISYPNLDIAAADAELSIWAREQAAAFANGVNMLSSSMPMPCELTVSYETLTASSKVVSVVFFISTAMGGAHPEPGLATFVYTKKDGRRLSYSNIFMSDDGLLETLSAICRESLAAQLGSRAVPEMLQAGTTPDIVNFDLFSLTKDGLRIYFPPYQAAPYSEGYLTVTIPLDKLQKFKPQISFWDKE